MENPTLITVDGESIRVGSPFAKEPVIAVLAESNQFARHQLGKNELADMGEDVYFQATQLRYTAMGAVSASTMVLFFALAAIVWFPPGGVLIAGLGCLLSLLGMASHLRRWAFALLFAHLALFAISYSQMIG